MIDHVVRVFCILNVTLMGMNHIVGTSGSQSEAFAQAGAAHPRRCAPWSGRLLLPPADGTTIDLQLSVVHGVCV